MRKSLALLVLLSLVLCSFATDKFKDVPESKLCQLARNRYIQAYQDLDQIPSSLSGINDPVVRFQTAVLKMTSYAQEYLDPSYVELEDNFSYNENIAFGYNSSTWILGSSVYLGFFGLDRAHHQINDGFCAQLTRGNEKYIRVGGSTSYQYTLTSLHKYKISITDLQAPPVPLYYDGEVETTENTGIPVMTEATSGTSVGARYVVYRFDCANAAIVDINKCDIGDVRLVAVRADTGNRDFVRNSVNGIPAYQPIYARKSPMNPLLDLTETEFTPLAPGPVFMTSK